MNAMVAGMNQINESGQNITRIIRTIDEIAFQTNLLALEAARGGRHSTGFAAVSKDVRNQAMREISDRSEGVVKKNDNRSNLANPTAQALEHLVSGIGKVTEMVAEIAATCAKHTDPQVTRRDIANPGKSAESTGQAS